MKLEKALIGWFRGAVIIALCLALFSPLQTQPEVQAISTSIVISQVYGGGGNSGATLRNDFVELYNLGSTTVDVTGWTVQYASSAGTTWQTTVLSGSIAPGHYYLVQEAQGTGGTTDLPTPDAVGTIAMSGTSGKVLLATGTTAFAGDCPIDQDRTIDFVGYGSATCYEGTAATATLSNTTAAIRAGEGCTETDRNSADFSAGTPNPRNTASPTHFCDGDQAPAISSTNPTSNAVGVSVSANIALNFTEAVNVAGSWFTISCSISGAHTAAVSGGPVYFTLNPDTNFTSGETCTVTVLSSQVSDQDLIDPPDTMVADYVLSFSVAIDQPFIHDIQGAAHRSSMVGQGVSGVTGIVTALTTDGFYMQEPDADTDADPATSEGIFVYRAAAPAVQIGDAVLVSGTVSEYRPGNDAESLSITEITSPTVSVQSSGNALPAPIVIGTGGRTPPSEIIEDDASGDSETTGTFDPTTDGLDFYESLEGMLVQVNDPVAVGPTSPYGELAVVADNGAAAGLRTSRGGIVVRATDFNPERIILDDEVLLDMSPALSMPDVNTGAAFTGAVTGVMSYSYGNYKFQVTQPPVPTSDGLTQQTTLPSGEFQLTTASFNVENLDPTDGADKFATLAELIVNHLQSPDLLTLEEVQDNTGATNDSTVDADVTLSMLITAIQDAGGPVYDFRQVNPVNNADGGEPGGNIRVAFLFRTDRGLSFVDRAPTGGENLSTTAVTVGTGGSGVELSWSPGRIDPTNTAFSASRKPLVGEFLYYGQKLFVVANHFNSKGGDQSLFGRYQPPTLSTEAKRIQQAQIVHDFVNNILTLDAQAQVIVMGDLNDFTFSAPLTTLKGSILTNLVETLPEADRYSYVYDGNSQALDHILVSSALNSRLSSYQSVHVNAEFASRASDHDPQLAVFDFGMHIFLPFISR